MRLLAIAMALALAGCTSSAGFKRDQLVCVGLCWEAETSANQSTGTTIKPQGNEDDD